MDNFGFRNWNTGNVSGSGGYSSNEGSSPTHGDDSYSFNTNRGVRNKSRPNVDEYDFDISDEVPEKGSRRFLYYILFLIKL